MFNFNARSKPRRSRSRSDGDRARDRQAWAEAIGHYRSHLLLVPEDAAIWVQLGHALKEDGRRNEALESYRKAWELQPTDSSVLLHFAHALLAQGDVQNGKQRLYDSAAAGNAQAAQDLARMGEPEVVHAPPENQKTDPKLLKALSEVARDLRPTACSDIKMLAGGRLKALSTDPWISLEWEHGTRPTTPYALLTVEVGALDQDVAPIGQIYVDLGEGFSERASTRFSLASGKILVILVDPSRIAHLRFDPTQSATIIPLPRLTITPVASVDEIESLIRQQGRPDDENSHMLEMLGLREDPNSGRRRPRPVPPVIALDSEIGGFDLGHDYAHWLSLHENPSKQDYLRMAELDAAFAIRPRFSFVMPTYNTPDGLLRECLDSLLAQTYVDFEICVADDNSPDRTVVATMEEYAARDERVKYIARKNNGHISAASNTALSLATGDFIVLVDHDDLVPDYTLFVLAHYINMHPDADILFSDEDKVTEQGDRLHPYFKSCFNQYLMYGHNMVSHLGVYRRSLVEEVGGFRLGLEGSQDYDLLLRCYERSDAARVVHIPHVLYHWRIIPGSTAMSADQKSYAVTAAQNSINGHFERLGMPFRSIDGFAPGCTAIRPSRMFDTSLSIIIPTRNGLDVLQPCIESIFARDCDNIEVIIMDNGSDEPDVLAYLDALSGRENVRVIKDPSEFNFSRINNLAAAAARGKILCFLNNDTEVVSADWLNRARALLSMSDVGMVGARLLFPDGTLQHFGIALGMGDHRIAGVPHLGMDASHPGFFGKARLLQEVSAVTAACMFVHKADFEAVGGFNEELRVAYNDIDLCLKIRDLGRKILVDPDITLIHKESRTRGSDKHGARAQRLAQEADWMRQHWAETLDNDPYYSPNIDLNRVDFAYAARPRQPWPWARQ